MHTLATEELAHARNDGNIGCNFDSRGISPDDVGHVKTHDRLSRHVYLLAVGRREGAVRRDHAQANSRVINTRCDNREHPRALAWHDAGDVELGRRRCRLRDPVSADRIKARHLFVGNRCADSTSARDHVNGRGLDSRGEHIQSHHCSVKTLDDKTLAGRRID